MTSAELWQAVGEQLRGIRLRQGYAKPYTLYQAHRSVAPAIGTIDAIEQGQSVTTESLDAYCAVLHVSLPDVLQQALGPAVGLDADALMVARAYQLTAHADLRGALRKLAEVALPPGAAPVPSTAGSGGPPQAAGDTKRSARTHRARR